MMAAVVAQLCIHGISQVASAEAHLESKFGKRSASDMEAEAEAYRREQGRMGEEIAKWEAFRATIQPLLDDVASLATNVSPVEKEWSMQSVRIARLKLVGHARAHVPITR